MISFSSAIRVTGDWRRAMALLEDMEDQHVELNWCRAEFQDPRSQVLSILHGLLNDVKRFQAWKLKSIEFSMSQRLRKAFQELKMARICRNAAIAACAEGQAWEAALHLKPTEVVTRTATTN